MGPQVKRLTQKILNAFSKTHDLDRAVDMVRADLNSRDQNLARDLASEIQEAQEYVRDRQLKIEILRRYTVVNKCPRWYNGPGEHSSYWPVVRKHIEESKGWDTDDVKSLDEASNEIVSVLADPKQTHFSCRGLVVGHIQSGKTANMTAVIAKAVDEGYSMVVVLAGLTNKLREQTQLRLQQDLVNPNLLEWQVHSPTEASSDFTAKSLPSGILPHAGIAHLVVMKKNVSPLSELVKAIKKTSPTHLARLRVLLIDDECDNASVNAAPSELDTTAINRWIRKILAKLPAVSYVGYTATPFANVIINPYPSDCQGLDDLYPKDFITSLPAPKSYFGTERLFGRPAVDPDYQRPKEDGMDVIRSVPEEDACQLQPASRLDKDSFMPRMAASLEDAILYFLACCAARRARGHVDKHMTMLVHTTVYTIVHERLAELIRDWISENHAALTRRNSESGKRIARLWRNESKRLEADATKARVIQDGELFDHLPHVLDAVSVMVENSTSEDRINYTEGPRTYVVVGGSILARGLTLEGLMVSYFLRAANQYDTLLQMGRWFGYRPGYEDLPRIWMPDDLGLRFRELAAIESEIREDISQYRSRELSPMDVAVRIRAIPGMAITAANKMRTAHECSISYWGRHLQTVRFEHRNAELLRSNWNAAGELLRAAQARGRKTTLKKNVKLWCDVPKCFIIDFFRYYKVHPTQPVLGSQLLMGFVAQNDGRLAHWNVGIVETARSKTSEAHLDVAGNVRLIVRSRMKVGGKVADIKALMSARDVLFDCENTQKIVDRSWNGLKEARRKAVGDKPLLLLYPIDRISDPKKSGGRQSTTLREALNAAYDVLAFGVVFPGSVTEGKRFVSVRLKPPTTEQLAEMDDQDKAQAGIADG